MALGRVQRATIKFTAGGAGDNILVAGIAGAGAGVNAIPAQKILVLAGLIVCSAAAMNPYFRGTADGAFGPLPLGANGGIVLPFMGDDDEAAWFVTGAGETLNLNVAAAGTVGGMVFYKTTW